MAIDWVQEAFQPLFERHHKSVDIIRNHADYARGTVFFDISDYDDMEGYNKFIPYYLFKEAIYCVGVSRSSFRTKISVGSNPWSPDRARTTWQPCANGMAAADIRLSAPFLLLPENCSAPVKLPWISPANYAATMIELQRHG